jgi:septal ring factor EnvC (AmiA/AmiB activator)
MMFQAYWMRLGHSPMLPFLLFGAAVYFVHRLVRSIERRRDARAELAQLRGRIAQLEDAQETTERDLARLKTDQDFAAHLTGARITEDRQCRKGRRRSLRRTGSGGGYFDEAVTRPHAAPLRPPTVHPTVHT